ncbi:MAG TPA: glycolate oxidase subunit GlcE [Burkholderiales bacterium]|nr:glycolate oxidase subunit GlcE [Burkholderiales bacterium]
MNDVIQRLSDTIREAAGQKRPLCIRGGGTKDFYGGPVHGNKLNTGDCRGIVAYEPTELVITARAGTPLSEIEAALREKGQMLAFEPPHFGDFPSPLPPLPSREGNIVPPERMNRMATLGGCVAAGLSGPRRPYAGAVRDFVLGVRILDGKGDDLAFGGQVMKNVAGYDVSRLMAGSLGTLGVLLEVSLKVLPLPAYEATLLLKRREAEAISLMNEWAARPLPVTATAYRDGDLRVRLSGAQVAVEAAMKKIGGEAATPSVAERFWADIREQTDPFFAGEEPLWRLSVKSTTPPLDLPGAQLIEWGGALRWLRSRAETATIRDAAARAGGHATLFRGGDKAQGVFHPLSPILMKLHRNLKQAFDPAGVLNPGRLYPDL